MWILIYWQTKKGNKSNKQKIWQRFRLWRVVGRKQVECRVWLKCKHFNWIYRRGLGYLGMRPVGHNWWFPVVYRHSVKPVHLDNQRIHSRPEGMRSFSELPTVTHPPPSGDFFKQIAVVLESHDFNRLLTSCSNKTWRELEMDIGKIWLHFSELVNKEISW